ncbi:stalk domain-containing protein [Paenibacillus sp. Soil787]|uniref:stalk domain-containing protein n=1 Tax=Paenibacillus sp. Soil787 TaxID=1736411 RepID=UPI0007028673|nr:stalk domain-containing protein [Paenibacillus sp. Soil787]KRF19285.1 hypothetical protein ASG93_32620 [Paenibacillus sp. Soil787]
MIATVLLFLCFTGVVHGSSIHGEYSGNPIVNVLFGGKELHVEDVPATIRDGRTLVPLYLLKQTGASVTWDSEKYNVDLTFPNPIKDFASSIQSFNVKSKAINRTDAEEFLKNKTSDFDYIKKWRFQQVNDTTDMSTPNTPLMSPSPAPTSTAPVSGPICRDIMTNYAKQMQDAAESYNGNGNSDPMGLRHISTNLKKV